jgi:squalene-hopene/tetraprenyl-beta-curcumene cyclase
MNRRHFLATSISAILATPLLAQLPAANAPAKRDPALRAKVDAAVEKGIAFLKKQQKPDGSWSTPDYPALTALCVLAHLRAPGGKHAKAQAAREGLEFVRKNVQPNGGIYAKGMGNYNTSICLTTLVVAGDAKDAKVIDGARKYLAGGQVKNAAKPEQDGGWGYESGGKMGRPDLDNTVFALEALRLAEKQKAGGQELMWKAAEEFVTRCQNLSATNKEKWASDDPENKGGFVYTPGESPAGEVAGADGKKSPRSYGSMSYAGLLSLLYAEVKNDDPRVLAAIDWLQHHFSVDENPGQGTTGLYYYYYIMAKTLNAAGIEELSTAAGKKVNWRADLAGKLFALQKPDGSWASENGRFMEKDPVLVTCYCLIALGAIGEKL